MSVSIVDPRECEDWDAFVDSQPEATVFHTSRWARVLLDTYGYRPLYHVQRDEGGTIVGAVPLMQVDGWLTQRRLVGLPFSDACAPLLSESVDTASLFAAVRSTAEESGAVHAELRGATADLEAAGFDPGPAFYGHVIPIDADEDDAHKRLHDSTRRSVRKAGREGVTVREANGLDDMREFYRLMVLTRKKHGLLPQPWRFFAAVHARMIEGGAGHLLLASTDGRPIAGDLLLRFRDQLVYKFNASDPRFLHLRPNHLLLWEAMRLAAAQGCRTLDLGRCDLDHAGLRRFKLSWGAEEQTLRYYKHATNAARNGHVASGGVSQSLVSLFVKVAPGFALRRVGAALYHNFG